MLIFLYRTDRKEKYLEGTYVMQNRKNTNSKMLIIYLVYSVLFLLFMFKMFFYANEIMGVPDQLAHLSYVIYLEENPEKLITEYENIKMYQVVSTADKDNCRMLELAPDGSTCYLGHPPLYYKLMQICDVIQVQDGHIYANMIKISYLNIFLTSVTMLIILYSGFIRLLRQNAGWLLHIVYASVCTCLPLYGYVGSGINNDNLCNLGMAIFIIGILAYLEEGCAKKVYWLIAAGTCISFFSKLTAGLVVLLVCMLVVILDFMKNKNFKILLNKYFAMTIPVYFVTGSYFCAVYAEYKTVQPAYMEYVTKEEFLSSPFFVAEPSRLQLTFLKDVLHFFRGMLDTWTSTYNEGYSVGRGYILAIPFILVLLLFLIQAWRGICHYVKEDGFTVKMFSFVFAAAIAVTIFVQFIRHRNAYLTNGYPGGYQARYYMPCLPAIAFGVCQFLNDHRYDNKSNGLRGRIANSCVFLMCLLMAYADFFYYLQSYY